MIPFGCRCFTRDLCIWRFQSPSGKLTNKLVARYGPWGPRLGSIPFKGSTPPRCGYLQCSFTALPEWKNPHVCWCSVSYEITIYVPGCLLHRCREDMVPSDHPCHPSWWNYISYINLIHYSVHLAGLRFRSRLNRRHLRTPCLTQTCLPDFPHNPSMNPSPTRTIPISHPTSNIPLPAPSSQPPLPQTIIPCLASTPHLTSSNLSFTTHNTSPSSPIF